MPWKIFGQALRDMPEQDLLSAGPLLPLDSAELPPQHLLLRFREYWASLREDMDALPPRERFSLTAIPEMLPWLTVFERHESASGIDYRVRVHGTEVVHLTRKDWTGTSLSEHFSGHELEIRIEEFERSIALVAPQLSRGPLPISGISWELSRGVFPFLTRSGAVQIFLLYVLDRKPADSH